MQTKSVKVLFLGLPIGVPRYISFQEKIRESRRENILFLEHPPTITAGINYNIDNLLVAPKFLSFHGISLNYIKRGGDFTAHEPGQIVAYFHIDLKSRQLGIADFLQAILESCKSATLEVWGISLVSKPDSPGLYLESDPRLKILSIGVYFKSWFTSYGVAFNVSNNFSAFSCIHPCGGNWQNMTSIQNIGLDCVEDKKKLWKTKVSEKFLQFLERNPAKNQ
ncbi:lipoyl(octanoyl) transferase LipB [Leptospira perolatii]|nr:lipoyl(octanoyl) transferase LipB [Leptospira perolatii]